MELRDVEEGQFFTAFNQNTRVYRKMQDYGNKIHVILAFKFESGDWRDIQHQYDTSYFYAGIPVELAFMTTRKVPRV